MMDRIGACLLYGWRRLRRSPGFTLVASASLAIAVAVAPLSSLNAVWFTNVAEGLPRVYTHDGRGSNQPHGGSSSADYLELTRYGPFTHLAGATRSSSAAIAGSTHRRCQRAGSRRG